MVASVSCVSVKTNGRTSLLVGPIVTLAGGETPVNVAQLGRSSRRRSSRQLFSPLEGSVATEVATWSHPRYSKETRRHCLPRRTTRSTFESP